MLHVHRAERADGLVNALGRVLADGPSDPFGADIVAVPTKGVERWLAQRLSHALGSDKGAGVCANVRFPQPSRLLADVVGIASGVSADDDPWSTGRMTWTLLAVIDQSSGEPWCAPLARHIDAGEGSGTPGRRFAVAQKIARLFSSYAANRPKMLREWADGNDTDGAGGAVDNDLTWQPQLWRRLREVIGSESPAERLPAACQRLRDDPDIAALPDRVSLFGPTRLSVAELDVLAALSVHRDVHLWLSHPSPALWEQVMSSRDAVSLRRRLAQAPVPQTPLVASLARDVRELELQLTVRLKKFTDHHHDTPPRPATLLGHLQSAIADDAEPTTRTTIDPLDRSVQVHACHGPARQVEVLREVLVGLLADDPTLEPRDVIVMCPNIEDYAALISAAFGLAEEEETHPGHRLRVRLADRSLRRTNPVLDVLATLLELAQSRVTATELLDLAAQPPVRRRFGFTDEDLELLHHWAITAGVRWGLDAAHRKPFRLDALPQNTWRTGLDRILLGAAMAEDEPRWLDTALPLDDVDSGDIDLAGRLAELVDRVASSIDRLSLHQPLSLWVDACTEALDLLTDVPDADEWQAAQARRALADLLVDAGEHAHDLSVSLGDVHSLLADRLEGRATRANFRTGHLTMCSMLPMRSVPHRVVCLLGLDDGLFPRHPIADGDDVLARDPLVGERDPRSEDRELLLDAVMAARDHLVILYTGADPRTNVTLPPAVPVGEILDAVDRLAVTVDGRPGRKQAVVRQPLQPFDPRNFVPDRLGTPRPFSYDRVELRGARRAAEPRVDIPPFLATPLPAPDVTGDVTLDELIRFFEHPARGFLRQRLGVMLIDDEEEPSAGLSIELKALEKWAVGDRLLEQRLRGRSVADGRAAEWRRGTLPPRALGCRALDEVVEEVEPLVAAAQPYLRADAQALDAVVDLGKHRVTGTIPGVRDSNILRVIYSRLAAKHRLRAWLQLLVLTAAHPGNWTAVTIGKGQGAGQRSTMGPVDPPDARALLGDLVDLRADGLCRVLPLVVNTSAVYAAKRNIGEENAQRKAEQQWAGRIPERSDSTLTLIWGEDADFHLVLAAPAEVEPDESTLFGELAVRVWQPILLHERLEQL